MITLSHRAEKYLATLERIEPVSEASVRAEFGKKGFPLPDPILEFHTTFAGYVTYHRLNRFEWGLMFQNPANYSHFRPNQICVERDKNDLIITCCNCHLSDHWFLNKDGELHWGNTPPMSASFAVKLERDAMVWWLHDQFKDLTRISFTHGAEALKQVIPIVEDAIVTEASDKYEKMYFKDGLYMSVKGGRYIAATVPEFRADLLKGIEFVTAG